MRLETDRIIKFYFANSFFANLASVRSTSPVPSERTGDDAQS